MTFELNTPFPHRSRSAKPVQERQFRVALIGPFAGEKASGLPQATRLDLDTLPSALETLSPAAEIQGHTLHFSRMESFEPLELAQAHPLTHVLLKRLSTLRKEGPTGPTARACASMSSAEPSEAASSEGGPEQPGASFDDLLEQAAFRGEPQYRSKTESVVDRLIRESLGPAADPSAENRFNALLENIASSLESRLRSLFHDKAFRGLEALWLPLAEMVETFDEEDPVRFILYPFGTDAWRDFLGDPQHAREWIAREAEESADKPDLIVSPCVFEAPVAESALAVHGFFGDLFACPVLANLDIFAQRKLPTGGFVHESDLPGMPAKLLSPDCPGASWIRLALPRFRHRLPYGEKGIPVGAFAFEEAPAETLPEGLPWAPSSMLYARAWAMRAGHEEIWEPWISPMQLTGFPPLAGPGRVYPATEFILTEKAQVQLQQNACLPVISGKNSDQLILSPMG